MITSLNNLNRTSLSQITIDTIDKHKASIDLMQRLLSSGTLLNLSSITTLQGIVNAFLLSAQSEIQASSAQASAMESSKLAKLLSDLTALNSQYLTPGSQTILKGYIDAVRKMQSTLSSGSLVPFSDLTTLETTVGTFLPFAQKEIQSASSAQASSAQASSAQASSAQAASAQASAAQASLAESKILSTILSSLNGLNTQYLSSA